MARAQFGSEMADSSVAAVLAIPGRTIPTPDPATPALYLFSVFRQGPDVSIPALNGCPSAIVALQDRPDRAASRWHADSNGTPSLRSNNCESHDSRKSRTMRSRLVRLHHGAHLAADGG